MLEGLPRSPDGNVLTIRKMRADWQPRVTIGDFDPDHVVTGAVVDTETTSLDPRTGTVIDVAVVPFAFDFRNLGLVVGEPYQGLQDPGHPLTPETTKITGLTDADVAGQAIDWPRVGAMLAEVDLTVAHNAKFDRPFVDRALVQANALPPRVTWGCSLAQIDWSDVHRVPSKSLEVLSVWHGFWYDAHRALTDCMALLYLLERSCRLGPLLKAARLPGWRIYATGSHMDFKDVLKARGYAWEPRPGKNAWWIECTTDDQVRAERDWMAENLDLAPKGNCKPTLVKVEPWERFK